jgi:hypothetical protein
MNARYDKHEQCLVYDELRADRGSRAAIRPQPTTGGYKLTHRSTNIKSSMDGTIVRKTLKNLAAHSSKLMHTASSMWNNQANIQNLYRYSPNISQAGAIYSVCANEQRYITVGCSFCWRWLRNELQGLDCPQVTYCGGASGSNLFWIAAAAWKRTSLAWLKLILHQIKISKLEMRALPQNFPTCTVTSFPHVEGTAASSLEPKMGNEASIIG